MFDAGQTYSALLHFFWIGEPLCQRLMARQTAKVYPYRPVRHRLGLFRLPTMASLLAALRQRADLLQLRRQHPSRIVRSVLALVHRRLRVQLRHPPPSVRVVEALQLSVRAVRPSLVNRMLTVATHL